MAALLYQYFMDMRTSMRNVGLMARKGSLAFIVLGDSETTLGDHSRFTIRTCDHVATLCEESGYCIRERIPITVTTEDRAHVKNAITDNQILVLQRR
jgi:hypothetical protein